jgi:hypothetical protein
MLFLLLLPVLLALPEDLEITLNSIATLHALTPYSTFYELFGVAENASPATIKSRFIGMQRKKDPIPSIKDRRRANLLITDAFNVLKNRRKTYDFILANSYIYFDRKENYKTPIYLLVLALIFVVVGLDLLSYGLRYLSYTSRSGRKDRKKELPKRPSMFIVEAFSRAKSLIRR